MKRWRITALLVGVLLAHVPTAVRGAADTRPAALREVGIEQRLNEQVPLDLRFRNEAGETVTLRSLMRDKPVILSLVYYECPMLCTLVLNGLVRSMKALPFDAGQQFDVITVSFNPDETPALAAEKKAKYLAEYGRDGAAQGWHFLTGDEASIKQLSEAVGFRYQYLPEKNEFAHASAIMVLTPKGVLARYFYGVEYAPRDVKFGLMEAAENRIGSPVDQLMLFCYSYDPATGRYSNVVLGAVRLGGAATVLAFVSFVLWSWRRGRSATAPGQATARR
ncbi:MAG: SCO family protein [Candidatus Binatia bacterium]